MKHMEVKDENGVQGYHFFTTATDRVDQVDDMSGHFKST